MNTQGWVRGLISHNYNTEKFVNLVSETISKEFNFKHDIKIENNTYIFNFDNYQIKVSFDEVNTLKIKSPYSLDKYLLECLMVKEFTFDNHKSQYTETVMGLIK